jgi:hypothetical protein
LEKVGAKCVKTNHAQLLDCEGNNVCCPFCFGLNEILPLLDIFAWLAACLHGTKIIKIAQPNPGASMQVFSFKRKEIFSPILDSIILSKFALKLSNFGYNLTTL